jgi:serine/threonine protein kinase
MSSQIIPSDSYIRFLSPPSSSPAPEHIRKLLSEYRITHLLGSGGFADVYAGIDASGRDVAIKIPQMKFDSTVDSSVYDKLDKEANIWKNLEHPNIVELYCVVDQPLPHIVMEHIDGGSLESLMNNHALTVGEAVHIMEQVLKGLSFAHRMASVHRDLKPENILFTADGEAKITDWGIGKFMASTGKSKTVGIKGTLDYCAPEQYNRRLYGRVDWQTDIFQVGVMFYEMLTGINPFAGEDFADCMGKVLMFDPKPPSSYNPDIPDELDEVIMGAIEKKKENRWESGAVMLNELKRVVSKKEIRKSERVIGNVVSQKSEIRDMNTLQKRHEKFRPIKELLTGKTTKKHSTIRELLTRKKKKEPKNWQKEDVHWENPIRKQFVKIPGRNYSMGRYTVTQNEWKAIMGVTPWKGKSYVKEGGDYPATYISWNDCQEFLKKLNAKEGRNRYRLPTEDEWEHACRAGSTTKYCFGDDVSRLSEYAWYNDMDNDRYGDNPKKGGLKKPNVWGFYDMHGNVWEWCQDWYDDEHKYRVNRGGSWGFTADVCVSSYRGRLTPDFRYLRLGVRIVRTSD